MAAERAAEARREADGYADPRAGALYALQDDSVKWGAEKEDKAGA
jgi:hypothetical protein